MWKDIKDFEGLYQVSEFGQIKSLKRHVENGSPCGMILKERLLIPTKMPNGYYQVSLCKNGKRTVHYVHRLVAQAYLDNPYNEKTVNHKDGNKANNTVSNLEFASYSDNNQHAYDTNLHGKGERHYRAILSAEQVAEIKSNGKNDTYENIAKRYNVSRATIRDVLVGNTWKN